MKTNQHQNPKAAATQKDDSEKVKMRYEDDRLQPDELVRVYTYKGREYRLPDSFVTSLMRLYDLPEAVRRDVLFVAMMRHNPD